MKIKQIIVILVSLSFFLSVFHMAPVVATTHSIAKINTYTPPYPEQCTSPDKEVVVGVTVGELKFNVTEINVTKGECFTLVFQNLDANYVHNIIIDEVGGGSHDKIDANLNGPNIDQVEVDSDGPTSDYGYGANGISKFNVHAPNVDVTFDYYCSVSDHRAQGMEGKLIVGTGKTAGTPGFDVIPTLIALFTSVTVISILRKQRTN